MGFEGIEDVCLLLVDDEDPFRNALAKRLGKRGAKIWQAPGGRECLELLAANPMDVVVMDVKMPGMDGIEALRAVKTKHPQTEVILLTGQANTQDGVEGIKAGAFDYIGKPVELEQLLAKIGQAYQKQRLEEEKRQAAELKAQMKQQMIATERLAALGTLAAGVAHEINNPLAIINEAAGFMTMLLEKKELVEMPRKADFDKALAKIVKSVKRAKTITHQLLSNVRRHDAIICEVDIAELAQETVWLVKREADHKGIEMRLDIDPSARMIWTDPNQVRQVLINLLTNAVHAIAKQGRITIQTKNTSNGVMLSVDDTGSGIPQQDLEKIFEPFFSTKPPKEGTGLGLFVSREIVAKLGGSIKVESRVGRGTRFDIKIPDQKSEGR